MLYVSDIIDKFGGVLLCGDNSLILDNFSHDTRTINEGDIYVGIKGESFDGNIFYEDAFNKGAKACILNKDANVKEVAGKTIVLVDNTLECIQKLAKYKREINDVKVVGITGSVGKTSTKDMVSAVLEKKYKVLKTSGNNNNHIGLPFTILKLKDEEVMVIEMGMNNLGEISFLTDIAKPNVAVITNVGTAHIGNLGSRENIMKAKLEIIEGLDGPLIINNDNDIMHDNLDYISSLNKVITVGINNKSDYMALNINDNLTNFNINNDNVNCYIGNTAFIYNSLIAYTVGKLFNVDIKDITEALGDFKLTSNRLEYKTIRNNITLIDDTYNASLDSIKSSLELLCKSTNKRKLAVIGDVLELGNFSIELHTKIGEELLKCNLDYIVLIGKETLSTYNYLKNNNYDNVTHFNSEEDSHKFISDLLKEDDIVLFKGSHGMKLNNIVNFLTK